MTAISNIIPLLSREPDVSETDLQNAVLAAAADVGTDCVVKFFSDFKAQEEQVQMAA